MTLEETVELLRRQLAALTEEVRRNRRYHPRNDDETAEDAETDSHSNFSNPIGQPKWGYSKASARSSKRITKMGIKHQDRVT